MKQTLLIILLSFLSVGFSQQEYNSNDLIEMDNGLFTWYYENGQKRAEETYIDGELDGLDTTWYENGQKKVEGTRKDGKLIEVTWWDEDGNVIKQFPPHHFCY